MSYKKKYIDLFAGCGGLSLGLHNSKLWEGVFAVEKNKDAFSTLKHNLIDKRRHFDWPDWLPVTNHDVIKITSKYKEDLLNLRGTIDLVAGGPPCQGFSTAGRRVENDNRNSLIKSYVKFIRIVQPKIIFFENVKGFTQKFDKNKIEGRIYSEYVKKSLRRSSNFYDYLGYNVCGKLVDFSEYGIPQKRTRFILVGVRKDIEDSNELSKEVFKHLDDNRFNFLKEKGLSINSTLADAISDLEVKNKIPFPENKFSNFFTSKYRKVKTKYQKHLRKGVDRKIPDSHRLANHSPRIISRFQSFLDEAERNKPISKELRVRYGVKKQVTIPLSKKLPTPTLTTLPDDYIHYSEPRIFTVREYARIQSFNDWYIFKGKYTTGGPNRTQEVPRYSQIGNAIPPLFGEQSGIALYNLIKDEY